MFRHGLIRFFRSYFKPMDPELAQKWYDRARYAYMFIAFQTVGIVYYFVQKEKREGAAYEVEESQVEQAIRVLGLDRVKVITIGKGAQEPYFTNAEEVRKSREENRKKLYEKFSV